MMERKGRKKRKQEREGGHFAGGFLSVLHMCVRMHVRTRVCVQLALGVISGAEKQNPPLTLHMYVSVCV